MPGCCSSQAAQRMQLKSFTAWVNLQLAKVSLKVNDLRTELEDGILLLKLVEAISGEELQGGKYYKNPVRVHCSAPPPAQRSAAHAAPRTTRRTTTPRPRPSPDGKVPEDREPEHPAQVHQLVQRVHRDQDELLGRGHLRGQRHLDPRHGVVPHPALLRGGDQRGRPHRQGRPAALGAEEGGGG